MIINHERKSAETQFCLLFILLCFTLIILHYELVPLFLPLPLPLLENKNECKKLSRACKSTRIKKPSLLLTDI